MVNGDIHSGTSISFDCWIVLGPFPLDDHVQEVLPSPFLVWRHLVDCLLYWWGIIGHSLSG